MGLLDRFRSESKVPRERMENALYRAESTGIYPESVWDVQPVGGLSDHVSPTSLVLTTGSAYTAGMVLGSGTGTAGQNGMLTLANLFRIAGKQAILQSAVLVDTDNIKPALTILLFNAALAGTYLDHAVPALTAADMRKCIRKINVLASDWESVGTGAGTTHGVADISAIAKVLKASAGTSLYALVLLTAGAANATYTNNNALNIVHGVIKD